MSRKVIMLLGVVVLLTFSFLVFASAGDVVKPAPLQQPVKEGQETQALMTKKLNLTTDQRTELLEKAKRFVVSTDGLTDEQIYEKVLVKENEAVIAKAKSAGINTDGLTAEQVKAVIAQQDKEMAVKRAERDKEQANKIAEENKKFIFEMAKMYELDTAGLSFEQIKAKVQEKLMPVLVEKAKALGIDYAGLSYDQLLKQVKAKH